MEKIVKILIVLFGLIGAVNSCYAEEYKILVLPDNLQFESTNYFVYPDASVMFASDTINYLKQNGGQVQIVSMGEVRDNLRKKQWLRILSNHALKEYKYNYNVSFVDLKRIADTFSVDKVLLISSTTDVQNYFLRRTLWDFLNIPGASVIDPAYKVSTHATLVDVKKEQVLWEQSYYKKLTSVEGRMIALGFAPANEQLEKIKNYSNYLSLNIALKVQSKILPPPVLQVEGNFINVSNIQESVKAKESAIPSISDIEIKKKPFVSSKSRLNTNYTRVNDI